MRYQVRPFGGSHFQHVVWDTARNDPVVFPGTGHYAEHDWMKLAAAERIVAIFNAAYETAMRQKQQSILARELLTS